MYPEDVFFLHEVDGYLYGYLNNIAYEFSKNDFKVTTKSCVSFDIVEAGNPLQYGMEYKSYYLGIHDDKIYKYYKWGFQHYHTLPFLSSPKQAVIHENFIIFSNNYAFNIETKQILTSYAEFPSDSDIFHYHNYFSLNNTGNLIVYDKHLKEIQYFIINQLPILTTLMKNIAILSNGKSTFILDLSSIPLNPIEIEFQPVLNFAYIFYQQELKFRSPQLSRQLSCERLEHYIKSYNCNIQDRFLNNEVIVKWELLDQKVQIETQNEINLKFGMQIDENSCKLKSSEVDIWGIRKHLNEVFEEMNLLKIQRKNDQLQIHQMNKQIELHEEKIQEQQSEIKRIRIRIMEM
ncbi:hypothetical protein SS50377_26735 [Spironucleus salmonicida]|uniref:Uncharacterized protein n=1 Tax=Spironucleus salmonicida TaxID=348837 RepID=V6LZN8_9EUKA|nr:hypothetical protein SS50377_26735 [Spironucleus salmonicida]|eukprot:EST49206.1 Hypothetical protein SS50377_10423 [Spironucleus salmonicida]